MPNSRELTETTALALDLPLPTVRQHMRNLRESKHVTKGGRGIAAPEMTLVDAAKLLLAVAASPSIQDGPESIERLIGLGAGEVSLRRFDQTHWHDDEPRRHVHLPLERGPDAIADVATTLAFLRDPISLLYRVMPTQLLDGAEIYATIEVEYPAPFASITVGIRGVVSQSMTYGNRKRKGLQQVRRCREDALGMIAKSFAE
jgi:hypothetical protein